MKSCFQNGFHFVIQCVCDFSLSLSVGVVDASHVSMYEYSLWYFHIVCLIVSVVKWLYCFFDVSTCDRRHVNWAKSNNLWLVSCTSHLQFHKPNQHFFIPEYKVLLARGDQIVVIVHAQENKYCIGTIFVLIMICVWLRIAGCLWDKDRHSLPEYEWSVLCNSFTWFSHHPVFGV